MTYSIMFFLVRIWMSTIHHQRNRCKHRSFLTCMNRSEIASFAEADTGTSGSISSRSALSLRGEAFPAFRENTCRCSVSCIEQGRRISSGGKCTVSLAVACEIQEKRGIFQSYTAPLLARLSTASIRWITRGCNELQTSHGDDRLP